MGMSNAMRANAKYEAQKAELVRWVEDLAPLEDLCREMLDMWWEGDDGLVSIGMSMSQIQVNLPEITDVNETMKTIHGRMRRAGYEKGIFDENYLTWSWYRPDGRAGSVEFRFSLATNGACKKVKVGVKQVDVFELRCDGDKVQGPTDD